MKSLKLGCPNVSLQGFINRSKPNQDESKLTVGNNEKVDVVFVGDVILILDSGFRLMLKDTFYVPSFRRNLVSVSCLDMYDYSFEIKSNVISLFLNSNKVGCCYMSNCIDCVYLPMTYTSLILLKRLFLRDHYLRNSLMHCGINGLAISQRIE